MPIVLSEESLREILITQDSPWQDVRCPDEVPSTNAASLADPLPWRVFTTGHQNAGRGRRERVWESPRGTSVAVSLTVPMAEDPARWGWLPMLTGLAVLEVLGDLTGAPERFALKWPNDVLLGPPTPDAGGVDPDAKGGAGWLKVCGILCEAASRTPYGPLAVAGIGVNIDLTRRELPVSTATSLTLAGLPAPARGDVVVAIAGALARRHPHWCGSAADMDRIRADFRTACSTLGQQVDVHVPAGEVVRGRAVDVAVSGHLVVEVPRADPHLGVVGGAWWERREFAAGDVVHVRRAESDGSGMIDS